LLQRGLHGLARTSGKPTSGWGGRGGPKFRGAWGAIDMKRERELKKGQYVSADWHRTPKRLRFRIVGKEARLDLRRNAGLFAGDWLRPKTAEGHTCRGGKKPLPKKSEPASVPRRPVHERGRACRSFQGAVSEPKANTSAGRTSGLLVKHRGGAGGGGGTIRRKCDWNEWQCRPKSRQNAAKAVWKCYGCHSWGT